MPDSLVGMIWMIIPTFYYCGGPPEFSVRGWIAKQIPIAIGHGPPLSPPLPPEPYLH